MSKLTPSELITRLTSWFLRRDRDVTLPSGRGIFITGANVEITTGGIIITGGNITIDGTVDGVDISVHAADSDAHHTESHALGSHSGQLDHDTDLSNVSADDHHNEAHTLASHSGTLDHGSDLTGLGDDDHPHYYNTVRADSRYYQKTEFKNTPGAAVAPLKSDSSGAITLELILTNDDARIAGGITLGSKTVGAPTGAIYLKEISAPSTPPSGYGVIWYNTSGQLWTNNDSGSPTKLAG